MRVLVLHGPNLNLLGTREKSIYGTSSLAAVNKTLLALADEINVDLDIRQSNSEGELVTWIQEAQGTCDGIIINPAGYTHTSVSIRDAIAAVDVPTIEVHVSNIHRREEFRRHSFVAGVALAQVSGFGPTGYLLALRGLVEHLAAKRPPTGQRRKRNTATKTVKRSA